MSKIILIFILLISIIILTLYIINRQLSTKEHYLTYFLPYYDKNLTDITKLYLNEDERKNFFKKKFFSRTKSFIVQISKSFVSV